MNLANIISTFSIVAADPETQEMGIAVQSKFLAVGAIVPFALAGVGAVATQAHANTNYGPRGLELLSAGVHPQEVIARLTAEDEGAASRQMGIVDTQGRSAAFTGAACHNWAGHKTGPNFAAQGNILVSEATVASLAQTFSNSTGPLAERLVLALAAGQEAGGDRRGRQSACLLVVKPQGGYGGWNDRWLDLRVDDHPAPIVELERLYQLHQLYFGVPKESDLLPLTPDLVAEIQDRLAAQGYYQGPIDSLFGPRTQKALDNWAGVENLEERIRNDGRLDITVLRHMRKETT